MDTGKNQSASGPICYADHESNLLVSITQFLLYFVDRSDPLQYRKCQSFEVSR